MTRLASRLLPLLPFALLARPAGADVVTLGAIRDNTIYSESGSESNGAGNSFFAGRTKDGPIRRGLIAFDVAAAIPAGATINSASLTLYMSRTRTQDQTVSLHRILAAWGEGTSHAAGEEGAGAPATNGDATWLYRFYDVANPPASPAWASAGGDFAATASATAPVGNTGFYSWASAGLAADVQAWLDAPAASHGWIVRGNEVDTRVAKRFESRQSTDASRRPVLTVNFTAPAATGACCATDGSCSVVLDPGGSCAGTYQGSGTVCDPNPCPPPTGACCIPDAMATCNEVTAAACVAAGGTYQGELSLCAATECPVIPTPFIDPLPLAAVAQPVSGTPGGAATYDMAMREVQQQLHSELPPTTVWGYGDGPVGAGHPGPTIEATSGQPVTVNWINDLRDTSVVGTPLRTSHYLPIDTCPHGAIDQSPRTVAHLHGAHVPQEADGHPEATFLPGQQVSYLYPNQQIPATLWYHDHSLGITRLNVQMGMAGFYLIRDAVEAALGLPSGEFELPLAIQDRSFRPDGSFAYPVMWEEHFLGETLLVNGRVWPYHDVKRGEYRLRLLNGCNSRTLRLEFCPGSSASPCPAPATFQVLGEEGGLLPSPVPMTAVTLGPAERADVVVDFGAYAAGTAVYLVNSAPAPFPGEPGVGVVPKVMKFVVASATGHTAPVPATLRPIEVLQETDAVAFRDFELEKGAGDACSPFMWQVVTTDGLNGAALGARYEDVTEFPELGTTEVWRFVNRSGVTHPMHMHLVAFQVLDRQAFEEVGGAVVPIGSPVPPPPHEAGWKDTVQVGPNEMVRVIARFEDYVGLFAYHCHIVEHEDHEMMREFRTVQCGNGALEPGEACDDGNTASGDGCFSSCDLEASLALYGLAQGGSVSVTVSGVLVSVATAAAQTPAQVVAALAAAITADATLAAQGVSAVALGTRLVTNGTIDGIDVADPGLSTSPVAVPSLSPLGFGLAAVLMLLGSRRALARRSA